LRENWEDGKKVLENLVNEPNIDIVVWRTLGLRLGKGKDGMSEKQIYLVAYKGS
jgi:hypothetical protein